MEIGKGPITAGFGGCATSEILIEDRWLHLLVIEIIGANLEKDKSMWVWVRENNGEIGMVVTVLAFLLSIAVLAFSAFRYVTLRRYELRIRRYEQYHELILKIGRGADDQGPLKLVSQRAFIYELRHFPEYSYLTIRLLESLLTEWTEGAERSEKLAFEIQDSINALK